MFQHLFLDHHPEIPIQEVRLWGPKMCISSKLLGAADTGPMGHHFSSTDLQDLERRKDGAAGGENSDTRGTHGKGKTQGN